MPAKQKLTGLYRNRVSYFGGILVGIGASLMLFLMALEFAAVKQPSPYLGIFTYMLCPGEIVFGLTVVGFGMRMERNRRVRLGTTEAQRYPALDLNDAHQRKRFAQVSILGTVLLVVFTYSGYNGFLLTESVGFCGKTCHTQMEPEMTAYENGPHARVACVECHIGGGAKWYVHSKLTGAMQLYHVATHTYSAPIPTPIKDLRPARETCEECHWQQKSWGTQLYQRAHFRYDEKSTPDQIAMHIKTGGGGEGGAGIHWHMMIDNEVTFVANDDHLQDIPWVKIKRRDGSKVEYFRTDKKIEPSAVLAMTQHKMDCMDCHNRPAHFFETPDVAVDRELARGAMSQTLPWVKSLSVDTLAAPYPTRAAAHEGMRHAVIEFYEKTYPEVATARAKEIETLVSVLFKIYDRNVFPDMKVSWATYPSNLGHRNSPGCFRCHDGKHVAADGTVLISECKSCHTMPQRGPQSGIGELMTAPEKDWHPWQIPEKHLAIPQHAEIQCYACHIAGRRPKTECNQCHTP